MELFSTGTKKRETYTIEVKFSLLWEAALGIAAITNQRLRDTLEYSEAQWVAINDSLSEEMVAHLEYVQKKNTWKALLQLLHEKDFDCLDAFLTYVEDLEEETLRWVAIPYLGEAYESDRKLASSGEGKAVERLQAVTEENSFLPSYIGYICEVNTQHLKQHLKEVMAGWYESVILPNQTFYEEMLKRDALSKGKMTKKLAPEAFVEWATHGVNYLPEPSVHKVIMIPQFIYRPWNVEADLAGAKVFYYPVANESIHPEDPYVPDHMLVQKYKALGDENRLRMLKMLVEKSRTLQEVTEEIGMGKTTVHHHLKVLKSARLVSYHASRYHVNPHSWKNLKEELDSYLGDGI
ncbi:ArsR/SmtB family transcription factor [Halobacillus sp. H74]|uniref:ArsR/SmtB family transcription factor n=1 Tax=Halobacillus sp. H74 TaxID=3457436 RepID=UPI003FCCAE2C